MADLNFSDVERYCNERPKAKDGLSDCARCPIHGACASGTDTLTQESLDAWRSRCVSALSAVLGQRTERAQEEVAVNG